MAETVVNMEEESLLLNDIVRGFTDFKGRPALRSKSGCWKSTGYISAVEFVERFALHGIKANLVNYLTGPLGLTTAAAAGNVNAWAGIGKLSPLLGAFIADAYLGRYWTVIFASFLYILGLGVLTLSAALHSFNYSDCKSARNNINDQCSPSTLHITFIFLSLYLVSFAQGGHRPCLQAFGADQFDDEDQYESKAKSSFFNWWNFALSLGALAAFLVLTYIQENISWGLGFGIPCIVMCLALLVFSLGTKTYRFRISKDEGNPFVRIGRLFVNAFRNWRRKSTRATSGAEEAGETQIYEDTVQYKFLDRALLSYDDSHDNDKVSSPGDIEDAKAILKLIPLWFTSLGYAIVSSQTSTLFTEQGVTMDRYITSTIQIPAASLQSFITLSVLVFVPFYDSVFIPIARAIFNKPSGITTLQRTGTGLFISTISMIVAALIERKRLATDVLMSIWWLVPQYLLCGFAYVFSTIGLQEFFYGQVPKDLKSIGVALCFSIFGIGNFLSCFLISVIEKATSGDGRESWFSDDMNRAHIDYFYWLLAGISAVSFAAYVYFAKAYVYTRTANT